MTQKRCLERTRWRYRVLKCGKGTVSMETTPSQQTMCLYSRGQVAPVDGHDNLNDDKNKAEGKRERESEKSTGSHNILLLLDHWEGIIQRLLLQRGHDDVFVVRRREGMASGGMLTFAHLVVVL